MTSIAGKTFRPMLRPTRKVHLPGTPGIYNTEPNWRPGPNWKPQSPQGPWHDGWPVSNWVVMGAPSVSGYLLKSALFCIAGLWIPFALTEYQLRKQSGGTA